MPLPEPPMRRLIHWLLVALRTFTGIGIVEVAWPVAQFVLLADPASRVAAQPVATAGAESEELRDVSALLEPIRNESKLPALAAAKVADGRLVALGAVGVRQVGDTEPVTPHDKFHLGSCTKSMTATLCAFVVQQGKLQWTSTVEEVFADQAEKFHAQVRRITLEQLLTHRSGLPEDRSPDPILQLTLRSLSGPLPRQRRALVELVLARRPAVPPGTQHQYSNLGYTLAGAMCERATGRSWEQLMREQLFAPLGMVTAGFGPPGSAEVVDQPRGHLLRGNNWKAMPPGELADNPQVIGPAGTVHCSLADWAKYAVFHLRGARGEEPRLPAEVFQKLHTPPPGVEQSYAFGWVVTERGWAGGKAPMHDGSNTMWYAVIWLAPSKNAAYLAATNAASDKAFPACDQAISRMIKE